MSPNERIITTRHKVLVLVIGIGCNTFFILVFGIGCNTFLTWILILVIATQFTSIVKQPCNYAFRA